MRKVQFLALAASPCPSQKNKSIQVPLTLRNLDVISWIKAEKVWKESSMFQKVFAEIKQEDKKGKAEKQEGN